MKYLVHEVRSQTTRQMIVRFRAPERVKEIQPDGKSFRWLKGFESVDGNTIKIFGRRLIFKELIFCSVSADDSMFWRDEHATIILDLTKQEEKEDGTIGRGAVKGSGEKDTNPQKASRHKKSERGIKNVA